ncbi:MAG: acyl-CoA dehydrogenase family protein [Anaerolineae bacterium]|jgi:butyryl-CoA dehydrogenase|nr:acyl-CoA dehydrogenase family protein [Anaerolineae bacterium]
MDFALTEEQQMFQELFRDFAENEVAPLADVIDREERPPLETLKKAAEMQFMGLPFPEEYGGAGIGAVGYCLLVEELAKACLATACCLGIHTSSGAMVIYLGGTDEQKAKYLAPLARGEKTGAFCLSEPDAGSDSGSIRTTAVRENGHYVLNGSKIYVANGDIAEVFTVFARTSREAADKGMTGFIVEKGYPGFKVGRTERTMGIRGCHVAQLFFDDCLVPMDNVLGGEANGLGRGAETVSQTQDFGRLSMAATCLGAAEGAMQASVRFAKDREQFGVPLARKQAVSSMIADMATEIEALRYLVYRTAWAFEQGEKYTRLAAMCKLFGSEMACRVANKAVQLHGGAGYIRDLPIERMYRDARVTRILEGTSEMQRFVIASDVFREQDLPLEP